VWRLRKLRLLCGFAIFTLLVIAIELPIQWNDIQGVYDFATITQLLPFLFSVGVFLRSWALYASKTSTAEENEPRLSSAASSQEGEVVQIARFPQGHNLGAYYYYPHWHPPYWYGYNQYQDRETYNYNDDYYYYGNNCTNWPREYQEIRWPQGVYYTR